jgi:RNA polymerase sigma factor (sigma-70 family)
MGETVIATGALLQQACDGDERAWDELVNRYTNLLWSVARSYRLDSADAADAVQTGWLRLLEHLGSIEDPERLVGWLVTTVRRECLRILRRQGRERPAAPEETTFEVVDPAGPVDSRLTRQERDAELWGAFERISERCQQLLRVLMASPPPSYGTVSKALGIPVGSIGPTRARCLARLRTILDSAGQLPGPRRASDESGQ